MDTRMIQYKNGMPFYPVTFPMNEADYMINNTMNANFFFINKNFPEMNNLIINCGNYIKH